jgi:hypothetical protein
MCYFPHVDLRPLDDRWLPVPDVAAILGNTARDVRNLIRSQHLLACRIEGLEGGRIPSAFLSDRDGIVDGLRGSIIQLTDSGMTADQAIAWLLSPNDELGCTPVAALHAGRKHAVRRAALGEAL